MGAFKPKRDDGRPQWQLVYELALDQIPGALITYDKLAEVLETDRRTAIYPVVAAANRKLWARGQRSLRVEPHVGYRVLRAAEHEDQASGYQTQARRRLKNAVAIMDATDLQQLTAVQRDRTLQVNAAFHLMARAIDDHATRLARHDDLIRRLEERIETLEQPS